MACTISVLLDDESHRALLTILSTGVTMSDAVSSILIRESIRLRSKQVQRREFLASQDDQVEVQILKESFEFIDSVDGPW
jgi:hypothetical protein